MMTAGGATSPATTPADGFSPLLANLVVGDNNNADDLGRNDDAPSLPPPLCHSIGSTIGVDFFTRLLVNVDVAAVVARSATDHGSRRETTSAAAASSSKTAAANVNNSIVRGGGERHDVRLQFFDTAGADRYLSCAPPMVFRGASIAILLYDAGGGNERPETVASLTRLRDFWIPLAMEHMDITVDDADALAPSPSSEGSSFRSSSLQPCRILVIGNKVDLLLSGTTTARPSTSPGATMGEADSLLLQRYVLAPFAAHVKTGRIRVLSGGTSATQGTRVGLALTCIVGQLLQSQRQFIGTSASTTKDLNVADPVTSVASPEKELTIVERLMQQQSSRSGAATTGGGKKQSAVVTFVEPSSSSSATAARGSRGGAAGGSDSDDDDEAEKKKRKKGGVTERGAGNDSDDPKRRDEAEQKQSSRCPC